MYSKRGLTAKHYIFLLFLCLTLGWIFGSIFSLPATVSFSTIEEKLQIVLKNPHYWFTWNEKRKGVLGLSFVAFCAISSYFNYYYRNFQTGREHGSAQWGNIHDLMKRKGEKEYEKGRILSQNVCISKSEEKISNNNVLVLGAPGSGKSFRLVAPNILTTDASVVVLDVKGDLLKKYGNAMKERGYIIKVLDLISAYFDESNVFNPFYYITSEVELIRLVMTLQKSVTEKVEHNGDPFWEDGVTLFLLSCFYYVWLECENPSITQVYDLICEETKVVQVDEDTTISKLEERILLLERNLNQKNPKQRAGSSHPAVINYKKFKGGAGDTIKSIIIICHSKFKFMEVEAAKSIFAGKDEFHLEYMGTGHLRDQKTRTITFLCIPDEDRSFDFIIAMFYSVLFQTLVRESRKYGNTLPIPVEIWMDEFANGARPANFENLITTLRSRNISVIMFLQSISQLKQIYKNDSWETLLDACATTIFLASGRGALSTHKYISELLAKTTIDKKNDSISRNKGTGTSQGFDKMGRELMTTDEVAKMDRDKCIIFIEGEAPIFDFKFQTQSMKEFKRAMELKNDGYYHPVKIEMDSIHAMYGKIKRSEIYKGFDILEEWQFKELEEKSNIRIKDRTGEDPRDFLLEDFLDEEDKSFYLENRKVFFHQERGKDGYVFSEEELLYFKLEEEKERYQEALKALVTGKEDILTQMILFSSVLPEWNKTLIKKGLSEGISDHVIRYILKEKEDPKEAGELLDYMVLYKNSGKDPQDLISVRESKACS